MLQSENPMLNDGPALVDPKGARQFHTDRDGHYQQYQIVLGFMAIWVIAVIVTISRIETPAPPALWKLPGYTSRHGYTYSLALLLLPLSFLAYWYARHRDALQLGPVMKSVLWVTFLIGLAWIFLDVFFANLMFTFPDEHAHVRFLLWGYEWKNSCATVWTLFAAGCYPRSIPVEEVVFYLGGAALLQMMYMWASEDFYGAYTMPREEYIKQAKATGRLIVWSWKLAAAGLVLFALGWVAKKWGMHPYHDGWPRYLLAEVIIVFGPLSALYARVRKFTNPRAFLFVMVLQLMVCLIWEASLALPLGWWNYELNSMSGLVIAPWSNLPIEACFLWLSVGWGAAFFFEVAKIKVLSERTWRQTLLGRDTWLR